MCFIYLIPMSQYQFIPVYGLKGSFKINIPVNFYQSVGSKFILKK